MAIAVGEDGAVIGGGTVAAIILRVPDPGLGGVRPARVAPKVAAVVDPTGEAAEAVGVVGAVARALTQQAPPREAARARDAVAHTAVLAIGDASKDEQQQHDGGSMSSSERARTGMRPRASAANGKRRWQRASTPARCVRPSIAASLISSEPTKYQQEAHCYQTVHYHATAVWD